MYSSFIVVLDCSRYAVQIHDFFVCERIFAVVGLVATFLNVHPTGASVDYIASYLSQLDLKLRASDIEDVLELCPSVFKQQVFGIGASIEKRWKFVAYDRAI